MVKRKLFSRILIFSVLFLMYLPIFILIVFSFTTADSIGNWTGFSFDLYINLFKNPEILPALGNTIIIALASAIISSILGTIGAIGIFYSRKRAKKLYTGINSLPIMNAEIVMALSLTLLFVIFNVETNFGTLLIGHITLTAPFVVLSVTPKLTQLDPNVYEAALDLGATPQKALTKVIIPEIAPGILTGFLLSITLSLDDYIITAFTKGQGFETLSTYIYGSTAKKGALPASLRALTTIIMIIILVILIFINKYAQKQHSKKKVRHNV